MENKLLLPGLCPSGAPREGTGGNISLGSFQLIIYSLENAVSGQLKLFLNVGQPLSIVFTIKKIGWCLQSTKIKILILKFDLILK